MGPIAPGTLLFLAGLVVFGGYASAAISLDPNQGTFLVGDRVHVSGHLDAPNTIAVYLFVTGPGLDTAGVTLENLKLRAGSGYFTSAFVHPDGSFAYDWDTAFSVGPVVPGTYHIYVVDVPLNLDRLTDSGEISISSVNVTFKKRPSMGIPLGGVLPVAALFVYLCLVAWCHRISG